MNTVITEPPRRANPYLDRIKLVQGDITQQDTEAVLSLIPQDLEYRGEVNHALLEAAGEQLDEFILGNILEPRPGDVYAVPGFNLKCKHILFCVVPVWRTDFDRHDKYLLNACRKAIETLWEMSLTSLSIPPLGSGKHGYPKPRAARLIVQGVLDRIDENVEEVRLTCKKEETFKIFEERLRQVGWSG